MPQIPFHAQGLGTVTGRVGKTKKKKKKERPDAIKVARTSSEGSPPKPWVVIRIVPRNHHSRSQPLKFTGALLRADGASQPALSRQGPLKVEGLC